MKTTYCWKVWYRYSDLLGGKFLLLVPPQLDGPASRLSSEQHTGV